MWNSRRREAERIARSMARIRRDGRCIFHAEWTVPAAGGDRPDDVYDAVLSWCREVLATARRPWGIDAFDLAVCRGAASGDCETLALERLRPADLYAEGGALRPLRNLITGGALGDRHFAVAMFSWGEAAHLALS